MTDTLDAKDAEIARLQGEVAGLREVLYDIETACEKRAHPGAELVISKWHLEDIRAIASRAGAALGSSSPATGEG